MKVVVDKIPTTPKECLFSKRNVEYGYTCQLHSFNPNTNCKSLHPCRDTKRCDYLTERGTGHE